MKTDEEDGDTAEQAMKVLKELVDNIVDNDNKYRAFAAQELTELANEWRRIQMKLIQKKSQENCLKNVWKLAQ